MCGFGTNKPAPTSTASTKKQALEKIWMITHRPSTEHPKGKHAYTHFMTDFDEIRALCKPFVDSAS